MRWRWPRGNQTDKAPGPASSPGGPVYDAAIHPAAAGEASVIGMRLQAQRDLHLFYGKTAAAEAFSHFREAAPSPVTVQMMGLARERDALVQAQERRWEQPWVGVPLGAVPGFHAAPRTNPVVGNPVLGKTHHAHKVESARMTRARLGR